MNLYLVTCGIAQRYLVAESFEGAERLVQESKRVVLEPLKSVEIAERDIEISSCAFLDPRPAPTAEIERLIEAGTKIRFAERCKSCVGDQILCGYCSGRRSQLLQDFDAALAAYREKVGGT